MGCKERRRKCRDWASETLDTEAEWESLDKEKKSGMVFFFFPVGEGSSEVQ